MYARTRTTSRTSASATPGVELPPRYDNPRLLASGGMGSVWCAQDTVLGRAVAIKVLAEGYADDPRARLRFMREARAAGRLSGHPNVVTVFDVGEADGRPYIVMEHVSGGSVADAIRVGEVSRAEALRWIAEAASALDHAHGLGILHRDVKPGNMLLGRNRTVHLADFGIARIAAEHAITNAGEMLGTAAYISPEQARGRPATGASDRYSLAVAAFELLVGERPFPAEHFAAQARAHMDDEPPVASEREPALSPAVDPVLMRGMSKDPDKRWPSAGAFADALERAVATRRPRPSRSVGAAAGSPPTLILNADAAGAASPARRGALAALAVAALLVGLLVGSQHGSGTSARNASVRQPAVGSGPARRAQPTKHHAVAKAKAAAQTPRAAAQTPRAAAQTPEAAAPVTPAASPTTSAPSASPTPSTSTLAAASASANGAALEARGHQLMIAGNYAAAIPVLRQALAAAGPASLTYAYALFDLGRSLRLAGDPSAAVPTLEARLKIPNQTGVVRHELDLALAALHHAPSGGAAPGGGDGPKDGAVKRKNRSGHGD
jgi:eukaryotic-like serine/threonine-protein kinase